MLVTNLTSGRVVAAIMTMGLLSTTIPVWETRDWANGAAGAVRDTPPAGPDRVRPGASLNG